MSTEGGRFFAALAYVLPLLGGLIGLAADGKNSHTRVHAQQSIAAILTLIAVLRGLGGRWAYALALIPAIGPLLSITLFSLVIAMAIFLIINWLVNLIMALRGLERTIPFANRVALRVFGAPAE